MQFDLTSGLKQPSDPPAHGYSRTPGVALRGLPDHLSAKAELLNGYFSVKQELRRLRTEAVDAAVTLVGMSGERTA